MQIQISQSAKLPTRAQLDRFKSAIIIIAEDPAAGLWRQLPYGQLLKKQSQALKPGSDDSINLPNPNATRVSLARAKATASAFQALTLARQLASGQRGSEVGVILAGFAHKPALMIAETLVAALLSKAAVMPNYKSSPDKAVALKRIRVYGAVGRDKFSRTIAEANGNNLARRLSALPPNELTPSTYLAQIRKLAKQYGWTLRFLDQKVLAKRKAGAFLAVAQGSPVADAGIVHLSYKSSGTSVKKKLALIGKGICFDTGGVNLKPANYMRGMHEDMEGSAVALGTLVTLSELKVPFTVDCWLAIAMNHIGPRAYLPNDVITAANGKTIEIVHTDAEGRMVLADTLVLASRTKPDLMVDYATLTGSCVAALGTAYSGVFTNREVYHAALIAAGRASGERVWPFPQDDDYDKALESDIADVKQCAPGSSPDHILAARFLQMFIEHDVPWVHVDLSAGNNKGGLAHIPTDVTAFGVRFTVNLLLDQAILTDSN